jgi:hypothetical protein
MTSEDEDSRKRPPTTRRATLLLQYLFNESLGITTIVPDEERGTLGHCVTENPKWLRPDVTIDARTAWRITQKIIGCFAGREAEKLFTGRNNHIGASGDDRSSLNLATYLYEDAEEIFLYLKLQALCARNLVSNTHWRSCIEAVATALLKKPILKPAEVQRIIRTSVDSQLRA